MSQPAIELGDQVVATGPSQGTQDCPTQQDELYNGSSQSQLPPCDGGRAAWSLLLTAFVFEALLWGFPLSFGVFQNYYSRLPQFKNDPFVSVIGTTASGIAYLAAPISIPLIRRFANYRRQMIWVGPLCLMGLVAGSFAKSLPTLILTQGVMYGVGFIIFYYPILSMINEYWIARRGMAYGFVCSASGVSGAAMPLCLEALLARYGYATTLRAVAVALFVTTGPLIPFLKGRLPEAQVSGSGRTDWTFLRARAFWIYSASNLAMGLGYFLPSLYLPSYATSNGMSARKGALLLAIMSVAQVLGQLSFGYLSDRSLSISLLAVIASLTAAAASYTCWGLAHTFGVLVGFSLIYGFFGAGYTALWGRMGTAISGEPTAAFTAFGLLNAGKGVGNIVAGPIGGAILTSTVNIHRYGSMRYEAVVLFTGSCMLISAATLALFGRKIGRRSRSQ
ncbi:hypothetical protein BAUCODRAFT_73394 [Baudoinia panamericana UAMH 10762]|uniref:Major facilitator superfamily (MFS) profile domain-containing protein n=1 Tax=Baudoinia panamericana (strain UAMH 10762) TaxID=717646 RepID=M2N7G2_BAUPA|nr:uncharacterized protein BAUCODRAFT_73394 [Baudoinia panamericana UAMH 10762]EMC94745.1 hypothetical protein BAUCODRAFT_73394 [Baudoinia panamericana UAMH 10762]